MVGETLGSYRIVGKLGEGGMGVVYVAEHALIGRKAAIKVLLPELSRNQEMVARFFNEARSTASIRHPGLVDVFDFGYHANGSAFLAMELLEGESLGARLRREHRLPLGFALVVARQVAGALGAAHAKGIVHRDLKPDNLFLVPDRDVVGGVRVKVLDFGIAKLAQEGGQGGGGHVGSGPVRTRTGAVMGSPLYMSPEQCKGAGQVDQRSDVYALGCILYECVCGRVPFRGEGFGEIIGKHMYEPPPLPRGIEPGVPVELEALILRALAKPVGERFQSMHELEVALDAVAATLPPLPSVAGLLATTGAGQSGALAPTLAPATAPTLASPSPSTLTSAAAQASPSPPLHSTGAGRYTRSRGRLFGTLAGVVATLTALIVVVKMGSSTRHESSASAPAAAPMEARGEVPPPMPALPRAAASGPIAAVESAAPPDAAAVAVAPAPPTGLRGHRPVATAPPPVAPPPVAPAPAPEGPAAPDVAALVDQAKDAYLAGQYARSLQLAQQALKLRPGEPDARMTAALAACKLKKVEVARRLASHMPPARRSQVVQACAREGVEL